MQSTAFVFRDNYNMKGDAEVSSEKMGQLRYTTIVAGMCVYYQGVTVMQCVCGLLYSKSCSFLFVSLLFVSLLFALCLLHFVTFYLFYDF